MLATVLAGRCAATRYPYATIGLVTPAPDHYFSSQPAVASAERQVTLTLPDGSWTLTTDAGVFSHGAVDPGTRFLLEEAPPPPVPGAIADIGCGYGVIAAVWERREPGRRIYAVDVNERALALTRRNTGRSVTAAQPEDVPAEARFAAIYSNPPIKIGKAALHELLSTWLARLLPGGAAYLVVSKHLGADSLARWLTTTGFAVARLGSRRGYRLLSVMASLDSEPL